MSLVGRYKEIQRDAGRCREIHLQRLHELCVHAAAPVAVEERAALGLERGRERAPLLGEGGLVGDAPGEG